MRPIPMTLVAVLCSLASACTDEGADLPFAPGTEESPGSAGSAASALTVMTRNLYVGADADAVIAALVTSDPTDDLPALVTAVTQLQQTEWRARAAAVADEIARARPHAVGLQEVSTLDLTLPPLGLDVHLDFLPDLLVELSARGLDYAVGARIRNFEAVPMPGVRLADDDAILLDRTRVAIEDSDARRYSINLGPVAPGVVLERGWVSATVRIGGVAYTVASTHLESGSAPGLDLIRAAQATELAQLLAGGPAIIMGDLNDVPGSPMHQALGNAGFRDVWAALRPGTSGPTCCHAPDLSNTIERFHQRIDYVFVQGIEPQEGELIGAIDRVGEVPADRISGPAQLIWPSDHAGLVARLQTLPPLVP